jgi:general secretion pathway protein D
MRRCGSVILCVGMGLFAVGCPKGQTDYSKGRKAETLEDYDAALEFYQKALKTDPTNANYKIRLNQARFEAGEMHVKQGLKQRENGDLQGAAAQFQRAQMDDPSSAIAAQELKKTLAMIVEQSHAGDNTKSSSDDDLAKYMSEPPEIKPFSNVAITYKATEDARVVFNTIGKLAGLTVIYDPDFPARRISVDLNNLTLEQALEVVCLESKAFTKAITENIIMVIPDQAAKRKDYEEEVLKTFYLANTVTPQDLTEILTGLRQLFDLKRVQQLNSQNAIVIRATPDVLKLVGKVLDDVDKAKPEVVVQVEVLEARTDRLRTLGIQPGQTASIAINPNPTTTTSSTTTTTTPTTNSITLNNLAHLNSNDYTVTLPNFTANAVLTDTFTKIIQNPELRSVDGQQAKLKIGDRIPIATGSFQAGVGVGAVGTAGLVNPLVNTQFQYQDVGVNIDMTPRIHPNRDVSLKIKIEVSSVTGTSTIGGISQPIISQRVVEHDIRLGDGQAYILGGLIQRTDTRTLNGWPGLAQIPIIRYLFSSDSVEHQEDEVLIMLIPHIVRLPEWTRENLRGIYSGPDQNPQIKRDSEIRTPAVEPAKPIAQAGAAPGGVVAGPGGVPNGPAVSPPQGQPGKLRFDPSSLSVKVGETKMVAVVVENVSDLFSIPMLLQYNPAVISIEDVQHAVSEGQHGGFLSGGTQEIAIVKSVNAEKGQAIISATRQPNTQGVSGSGTLVGIVIKGIAPGSSNLTIMQQNAKDSQQRPIPLVTNEATVQVQP